MFVALRMRWESMQDEDMLNRLREYPSKLFTEAHASELNFRQDIGQIGRHHIIGIMLKKVS